MFWERLKRRRRENNNAIFQLRSFEHRSSNSVCISSIYMYTICNIYTENKNNWREKSCDKKVITSAQEIDFFFFGSEYGINLLHFPLEIQLQPNGMGYTQIGRWRIFRHIHSHSHCTVSTDCTINIFMCWIFGFASCKKKKKYTETMQPKLTLTVKKAF